MRFENCKMHICFLCNEYPPGQHGGLGSFTQTLGRELSARGHQVTVVGVYPAGNESTDKAEDDCGVRVIRLAHATLPGTGFVINRLRLGRALRQIHRETPIDVIEGAELSMSTVPRSFPAAKVIRMHGGHHFFAVTLGKKPRPWRSRLEFRSFANADHICAVSQFVADTTRELLGLGNRPIEILPNPIDISLFQPRPEESEESGLIVFVGTVAEKKGVRQLIQAIPAIVEAVPHARLWVVGRDSRDPQTGGSFTEYLRGLIPAELTDHVVFKGAVDRAQLPSIMSSAQICVYPSHMEALPIAWLEGLAMGKAMVVSQTGPGPEVVENGVSGLLCDPHDPASIADKLVTLLKDADLRQRLGSQARARAVEHFSKGALVKRNEEFYERCIREHHGA